MHVSSFLRFAFLLSLPSSLFPSLSANHELINFMLRPIECSRKGIKDFFSSTYNHPGYKDFLPACFMHILDLVEHAHNSCNDINFLQQIFIVFTQKLKEASWTNPYALLYFLERIQPYLIDMYISEKHITTEQIEDLFMKAMETDKELLEHDPRAFIKKHTPSLIEQVSFNSCTLFNAKQSFITLVDHALDRIVFDHTEGIATWHCFLQLISCIENMNHSSLLYDETIYQRMLWSICTRFIYCMELHYSHIPDEVYKTIQEELANPLFILLDSAEIEPLIMSKREWVSFKIAENKAKKISRGL